MAVTCKVQIVNAKGLHARPAAQIVKCAEQFEAEVTVHHGDDAVLATSIMGLLMLAATPGTILTLTADGVDAEAALEAVAGLISNGFGEDAASPA